MSVAVVLTVGCAAMATGSLALVGTLVAMVRTVGCWLWLWLGHLVVYSSVHNHSLVLNTGCLALVRTLGCPWFWLGRLAIHGSGQDTWLSIALAGTLGCP